MNIIFSFENLLLICIHLLLINAGFPIGVCALFLLHVFNVCVCPELLVFVICSDIFLPLPQFNLFLHGILLFKLWALSQIKFDMTKDKEHEEEKRSLC